MYWLITLETILTNKFMTKDEAWDILLVKRKNYIKQSYDFLLVKWVFGELEVKLLCVS